MMSWLWPRRRRNEWTSGGEISVTTDGRVVMSFPEAGFLRMTMTPKKARALAADLLKHADEAVLAYEFKTAPPESTT